MFRIAELKFRGVPIQLRYDDLYDRIGSLFGKIVCKSEFSWQNTDVSEGSCRVLTDRGFNIEEEVNLIWHNRNISIWVSEVASSWTPEFD
ncbi:MAG: hypothetical protein Q8755_02725, partial [Candidatus Phytoplasma australasiaticum]|nr:hypothetical protein [Candidatus Phytoplasma australasiaticum]